MPSRIRSISYGSLLGLGTGYTSGRLEEVVVGSRWRRTGETSQNCKLHAHVIARASGLAKCVCHYFPQWIVATGVKLNSAMPFHASVLGFDAAVT